MNLNGWHALLCIANNRHDVTITTHAIKRHFLIWMTTVRQPTKRRRFCVLTLKYTFICVYWWTRQRIHNTLIVVDRYLRLLGDKTIPDSAEPRLESFYPPFVAGIDLPHQGVVDSYSLVTDARLLHIDPLDLPIISNIYMNKNEITKLVNKKTWNMGKSPSCIHTYYTMTANRLQVRNSYLKSFIIWRWWTTIQPNMKIY